MPFQSAAQRRFLYSQEPDVAEKFAKHEGGNKKGKKKGKKHKFGSDAMKRRMHRGK